MHGYFDHTAWMRPLIELLLERGDRVIAIDLPGHGLSDGVRGYIADFSLYAHTLQTVYEYFSRSNESSLFFGQSTGATGWIHWSLFEDHVYEGEGLGPLPEFQQVHLMAPLVRVSGHRLTWIPFLYKRLFKSSYFPRKKNFKAERDPLANDHIHTHWIWANRLWHKRLCQKSRIRKDLNIHVWSGNFDITVDWIYNIKFLKEHYTCEVEIFNGVGHRLIEVPHVIDKIIESSTEQLPSQID